MQSPGAFCIVPPDTQKAAHTGRLSFCHEIRKTLENQGFRAETEGFEPSYRDEPINAFRVRRVTAASLRLQNVCLFKKGRLHIIIHIFSDLYREITK